MATNKDAKLTSVQRVRVAQFHQDLLSPVSNTYEEEEVERLEVPKVIDDFKETVYPRYSKIDTYEHMETAAAHIVAAQAQVRHCSST